MVFFARGLLWNTYISHASDFCDWTRIGKLNILKFMEFAHYRYFICIEYQHLKMLQIKMQQIFSVRKSRN